MVPVGVEEGLGEPCDNGGWERRTPRSQGAAEDDLGQYQTSEDGREHLCKAHTAAWGCRKALGTDSYP